MSEFLDFQIVDACTRDVDPPRETDAEYADPDRAPTVTSMADRFLRLDGEDRGGDRGKYTRFWELLDYKREQGVMTRNSCCSVYVFGRCSDGSSVCLRLGGWRPRVLVMLRAGNPSDADLDAWVAGLELAVHGPRWAEDRDTASEENRATYGFQWSRVRRHASYGYEPDPANPLDRKSELFVAVRVPTQAHRRSLQWMLSKAEDYGAKVADRMASLPVSLQFDNLVLADAKVSVLSDFYCERGLDPSGWVRVPLAGCRRVQYPRSTCDQELECPFAAAVRLERAGMANLVVAAWDIETQVPTQSFPDPRRPDNPVTNIGVNSYRIESPLDRTRVQFCLTPQPEQAGTRRTVTVQSIAFEVRYFASERLLLEAFALYLVRELGADMLVGYNVTRFDINYLLTKAGGAPALLPTLHRLFQLSRFRMDVCGFLERRDKDTNKLLETNLVTPGVIQIDLYGYLTKYEPKKLDKYTLSYVCQSFLGPGLDKVHLWHPGVIPPVTSRLTAGVRHALGCLLPVYGRSPELDGLRGATLAALRRLEVAALVRERQEELLYAGAPAAHVAPPADRDPAEEPAGEGAEEDTEEDRASQSEDGPDAAELLAEELWDDDRALVPAELPAPTELPAPADEHPTADQIRTMDALACDRVLLHLDFRPAKPLRELLACLDRLGALHERCWPALSDSARTHWRQLASALVQDQEHLRAVTPADRATLLQLSGVTKEPDKLTNVVLAYLKSSLWDAAGLLGDNNYFRMFALCRQNSDTRLSNAFYCTIDCERLIDLMVNRAVVAFTKELSSVSSTPMADINSRGQQVKGFNNLVRTCRSLGYLMTPPVLRMPQHMIEFVGATVQDPKVNLFLDPVATFDFASLYPSIMLAFNLCFSTYVNEPDPARLAELRARMRTWATRLAPDDPRYQRLRALAVRRLSTGTQASLAELITSDVTGEELLEPLEIHELTSNYTDTDGAKKTAVLHFGFVQHLDSVTTSILNVLTGSRKAAKALMERETPGSLGYAILNGRQTALKLLANSLYGFYGVREAGKGMYPCLPISVCVTLVGRFMIQKAIDTLLAGYGTLGDCVDRMRAVDPGFAAGLALDPAARVEIVYGDTDSMMVRIPQLGTREVFPLCDQMRDAINARMPRPMKMEFEKAFVDGYLLVGKKRYAGKQVEPLPDGRPGPPVVKPKGLDSVRRDKARFLRDTYKEVISELLAELRPDTLEATFRRIYGRLQAAIRRLVRNELPVESFALTKSLAAEYKGVPPVQKVVADKLLARNSMKRYMPGDRVEYVQTAPAGGTCLQGSDWVDPRVFGYLRRSAGVAVGGEDPDHALEAQVPVDRMYYANYLANSLKRLVTPMQRAGFPSLVPLLTWAFVEISRQQGGQRGVAERGSNREPASEDQDIQRRKRFVGPVYRLASEPPGFDDARRATPAWLATGQEPARARPGKRAAPGADQGRLDAFFARRTPAAPTEG